MRILYHFIRVFDLLSYHLGLVLPLIAARVFNVLPVGGNDNTGRQNGFREDRPDIVEKHIHSTLGVIVWGALY